MPRRVATWAVFLGLHLAPVHVVSATAARPISTFASSVNSNRSCLACIGKLRGGAPHYELNQNYQHSPTLGDVDKDGFYHASFQSPLQNSRQRPPPLSQLVVNYLADLRKFSPTLFNGTMASLLLFLAWQFPSKVASKILGDNFVCSRYNLIRKKRCHTLVLSAFSHASFRHLAVNMYAYTTFGRSVKQVLASHGLSLSMFVVSAAAFANLVFLLLDKGGGSCIGLSGVTLALLAFDSLVYPTKELRLFVAFVPISLPAYYLLLGLTCFTVAGILGFAGQSNVAHSTHLGGLIYGALFYEAFKRGWPRVWNNKLRKAYQSLRGC